MRKTLGKNLRILNKAKHFLNRSVEILANCEKYVTWINIPVISQCGWMGIVWCFCSFCINPLLWKKQFVCIISTFKVSIACHISPLSSCTIIIPWTIDNNLAKRLKSLSWFGCTWILLMFLHSKILSDPPWVQTGFAFAKGIWVVQNFSA